MKRRVLLALFTLVLWGAATNHAWAKVRDSIVFRLVAGWSPIEVVVLGHLAESETGPAIAVEKSYLGHLSAGDVLPLQNKDALGWCARQGTLDDGKVQPRRFVIFLNASAHPRSSGQILNESWRLDSMVSKCIVGDLAYAWMFAVRDSADDLPWVERRIEAGLAARNQWQRAWTATDTTERLALLRSFFVPADDSFIAHYDVMTLMMRALKRFERNDPETRRFVEDLLALPQFQDSYTAHGNWRNFGKNARRRLQAFLAES